MLKRYRGLNSSEMLKKQSSDLREGKVRVVVFYIEQEVYEKLLLKNKKEMTKFRVKKTKDSTLIGLVRLYETSKLEKVNANAYLQYKTYELYNKANFVTVDNSIIKGVDIRALVQGYYTYKRQLCGRLPYRKQGRTINTK